MSRLMLGLLACPVGHSVSPAMHEAALREAGLDGVYLPFEVPPAHLETALRGMAALGFTGTNVTIPHKVAALHLSDEASEDARAAGAANTLVFSRSPHVVSIAAHNTDVSGFLDAWEEAFGAGHLQGRRMVVVGAGGAARAVVVALARAGISRLTFLNRSVARSAALIEALRAPLDSLDRPPRSLGLDAASLAEALCDADGLVQTTSVGMGPSGDAIPVPWPPTLPRTLRVMDLIYNPRPTRFLREAAARGALVCDGLGMLVAQGAEAFRLWTLKQPSRARMRAAAEALLGG